MSLMSFSTFDACCSRWVLPFEITTSNLATNSGTLLMFLRFVVALKKKSLDFWKSSRNSMSGSDEIRSTSFRSNVLLTC